MHRRDVRMRGPSSRATVGQVQQRAKAPLKQIDAGPCHYHKLVQAYSCSVLGRSMIQLSWASALPAGTRSSWNISTVRKRPMCPSSSLFYWSVTPAFLHARSVVSSTSTSRKRSSRRRKRSQGSSSHYNFCGEACTARQYSISGHVVLNKIFGYCWSGRWQGPYRQVVPEMSSR
jgi:hypothetical protein